MNQYLSQTWEVVVKNTKVLENTVKPFQITRFYKGIHNILVEQGFASENTAMLLM